MIRLLAWRSWWVTQYSSCAAQINPSSIRFSVTLEKRCRNCPYPWKPDALELGGEGHSSSTANSTRPAPNVLQSPPKLCNPPNLCASIRSIKQEEARRTYAFEVDKSLVKFAKDALSYVFQGGYEEANYQTMASRTPCSIAWRRFEPKWPSVVH